MSEPELVVVGAGPAGMAAATVAGDAGVRTLMLDEYRRPGGQYYRQPESPVATEHRSRQQQEGARIIEEMRSSGASFTGGSVAYAVEEGKLYVVGEATTLPPTPLSPGPSHPRGEGPGERGRSATAFHYDTPMILAPGATERVVPVPGWTLPGVVTCGGAQTLAKAYGMPIGNRVIVAGSGPFLLPVAATLVELGATVVAVVEAQSRRVGAALAIARSLSRAREAAGYFHVLMRAHVPMLLGYGVVHIDGDGSVSSVTVAPIDDEGAVRSADREHPVRRFEVDAVALSDGFIPATDLAELAGASLRYGSSTRTHLAQVDPETGATTADDVWAAGACVEEMCGAQLAAATGTLAGLAAVEKIHGSLTPKQHSLRSRALLEARRQRAFAQRLAAEYPVRSAWYRRATDDTIVCRCEDVRAGDIRAAAVAGASDVNLVKRWTRAGMGLCQGRTCQSAVIELVATANNQSIRDVGRFHPRPPIRPVPLQLFAAPVTSESE